MLMTIAELSDVSGYTVETLHQYERLGLIRPVVTGEFRRYGEDSRLRLEVVRKGKRLGFSLQEIVRLLEGDVVEGPVTTHVSDGVDRDGKGKH